MTIQDLEWQLKLVGAVESDLEVNPKSKDTSLKKGFLNRTRESDSESDDD